MNHWERLNLRRHWSEVKRRYISRDSNRQGEHRAARKQPDEEKQPPGENDHHRRERKWGTYAERIIAFFTVVLGGVSYAQWALQDRALDLARDNFNLAQDQFAAGQEQANASSTEAAASRNIQESVAAATSNQAAAMNKMAGAAEKQAGAGERQSAAAELQARTSARDLAFRMAPNLDAMIVEVRYTNDRRATAKLLVSNHGQYKIYNVTAAVRTAYAPRPYDITRIWSGTNPLRATFDSVAQGRGDELPFPIIDISDREWNSLINRRATVVFGAQITFRDAADKDHTLRRCIAIFGPPPGEVFHSDCENLKAAN